MSKYEVCIEIYHSGEKMSDPGRQEIPHLKPPHMLLENLMVEMDCPSSTVSSSAASSQKPSSECVNIESVYPSLVLMNPSIAEVSLRSVGEGMEVLSPLPSGSTLPIHPTISNLDIYEAARRFSELTSPRRISEICIHKVPSWNHLSFDDLEIGQLLIGLSNQLFEVRVKENCPLADEFAVNKVLFRIYGKEVRSIYDPAVELKVFKALAARGVAPHLVAEFQGGRIEEWIEGGSLSNADMSTSSVIIAVASILANIHSLDLSATIDATPSIYKYLARWREGAMSIFHSVDINHPSYLDFQRLELGKFCEESYKLQSYLFPEGVPENEVTRLAFCHNDIQENNIMVSSNVMRLIDFEYSGYNYPAFDISSFFWEMTCDYTVKCYPFFFIDPTRYPSLKKRRLFCAMYLTKLTDTVVTTSAVERLDPLLNSIERFQLACHMLWAFWSIIRAPQAATATSFDMLYYAQKRIDLYWAQKAKLISQKLIRV